MAKKVHLGSISFLILIFAASASAATPACGTHLTSDTTYVFDQDLNCTGGGISQALLYASNRHNITVDCAGYKIINKGTWNYGFRIGLFNQPSRNITIKDCEIVNVSTGTGGYGIRLDGTNRTLQDENITIVNTTISFNDTTGNSYWGISGSYSGNVTIDNVTILARGDGIELHDCGDVLIQDCNISGGQSNGVELLSWGATNGGYYATNTTIEDCNITGMGGQGIYLVYYSGVDVRGNNLSGNGVGMSIFGPAENINVSHNEMFNNTQRGISIFANLWPAVNRDFVISYNNITHTSNGPGLDMENSLNGTLVSFNNISHNSGHGVDADGIYLGDDIAFRNNTITFNDYAGLYLTGVYDDLGLYGNTVCSNGLAGGYSDIHAVDTVYGDDNTCESTAGYADDGRFGGCDTSCTGCVDADMDGFYPTPGCIEPLDCDDADASRIPAREDLVIDRDIVLCPGTYYLDDEAEDGVLSVRAPSVTLDCNGAVFIGDYDPDDYLFPTCIYIDKDNVTVKNCDITQYDSGIDSGAQNATVLNNTIANTSSGITVRDANNTVRGNTVSNSVQGIEAYFESSEISDNVLEDTVVGIYLSHPQSSTISGNTITSDITEFTREILEEFSDPELTYGIFIRVYDGEASDNDIYENTISGSDYGIALNEMEEEGSFSSNDVSRNDISGCVFGIYLNISSGNRFDENIVCDSTDTDFYVENKDVTDVGDDNTCQTTFHWNDVGATGCTDKCLPEEEEDEQKEKKTGGGGAITFATYTGPTIGLPEGEEGGQEGGAGEQQGEPEITGPGSIQEGNEMTFTLINSDSTPADGQVTITKPDGTTMTVSVTGGALHVDFDQPGTWTITYTDPSGKTVTKTINVLAAPEEETPPAPIPQPVIQPKTPAPTDNTLLYLLGGAVLLGFVAVLFLKKSGRI